MSLQEPEQGRAARKQRTQRIGLAVGILVALGALIAAGAWYTSDPGSMMDNSSVEIAVGDGSILVGSGDAPVKVVIYEDFLCPPCRELADSTRDFLRENAARGKVQVEYRPINLLTGTTYSARAMNAWAAVLKNASPTDALKLHDLLLHNQPDEASADDTSDAEIAELVREAGADNAGVLKALTVRDLAFFAAAAETMADQGVTGTPTVLIDGRQVSAQEVLDLVEVIEKAVSGS